MIKWYNMNFCSKILSPHHFSLSEFVWIIQTYTIIWDCGDVFCAEMALRQIYLL